MELSSKIYIAGQGGMVGSAILRKLKSVGYSNFVFATSKELDLRNQSKVNDFFDLHKPEYVFLAAAKVGGIHANNEYRANFIYDNIMIQSNVIHASYLSGVKKLMFLGSSCIYPKLAPQPLKEEFLLTGLLESTNEPYAIAKIAGIKMCQAYHNQYQCNFISVMPTNLYGPNDNYDVENSHVLPALIRKIITAKKQNLGSVEIWGTGTPKREFLHADDLADACYFLMKNYNNPDIINIGVGNDISILELTYLIKNLVGYEGEIFCNTSMPDGTPRKLMDVTKLSTLGWKASINLEEGIQQVLNDIAKFEWAN